MVEQGGKDQRPAKAEDTGQAPVSALSSGRASDGRQGGDRQAGFRFAADRKQPPGSHGDGQPQTFGPCGIVHARVLPLPPPTLEAFEALFDPGAQTLPTGVGGLGRQISQHQPGVLMAGLPATHTSIPQQGAVQTDFLATKGGSPPLPTPPHRRDQFGER